MQRRIPAHRLPLALSLLQKTRPNHLLSITTANSLRFPRLRPRCISRPRRPCSHQIPPPRRRRSPPSSPILRLWKLPQSSTHHPHHQPVLESRRHYPHPRPALRPRSPKTPVVRATPQSRPFPPPRPRTSPPPGRPPPSSQ